MVQTPGDGERMERERFRLTYYCLPALSRIGSVVGSPVNMLDLIHIQSGSDWKHWPEADLMILAHCLVS